jgi:hypothetical protein
MALERKEFFQFHGIAMYHFAIGEHYDREE